MKIIFLGTPELAVPSLRAISGAHEVVLVVTQPDRPRGRGRQVGRPPVKEAARIAGLPCRQPTDFRSDHFLRELKALQADIMVVVAFGRKLPDSILSAPPLGAINLHFSLLPAYRGAAPVNWAIINGERSTGVTTFQITATMDGGPFFLRRKVDIEDGETAGSLGLRLAQTGAEVLAETITGIGRGALTSQAQNEERVSLAPKLRKEDGHVDWGRSAESVVNLIRGVNPWPGAFSTLEGATIKLWEAAPGELPQEGEPAPPGTILTASPKRGLLVSAGEGAVSIKVLQEQGRKRLSAREYLAGHRLRAGMSFN